MNKIIVVLFCLLLFSCDNMVTNKATFSLVNYTTKKHIAIIETEETGTKDLKTLNMHDSSAFNWTTRTSYQRPDVGLLSISIYNLSDTMNIDWNLGEIYNFYYSSLPINHNDSIVKKSLLIIDYNTHGALNMYYKVSITDTLLTLFKKNYSMLEKFKDYYSSKP